MKVLRKLAIVATFAVVIGGIVPANAAEEANEQKAVLVTGASTGIGRNVAERLAENGYFVYAGARKQEDIDALNAIDNIMAVRLDVTVQDDIDAAVALIASEGRGLYGLVNNAGVASFGPLSQTQDSVLDFVFNVNVNGVVRVTRAFVPMLAEQQGSIVTIGSLEGLLSSPMLGVYSMSKLAIEAFTDTLASELAPAGVGVSIVVAGNYKSHIRETTANRTMAQMRAAGMDVPDEVRAQLQQLIALEQTMAEPDAVAETVIHALFSEDPKRRYMVVPVQQEAEITIRTAIEELVQLNEGHAFSYDRDQLVEMLDQALSAD